MIQKNTCEDEIFKDIGSSSPMLKLEIGMYLNAYSSNKV